MINLKEKSWYNSKEKVMEHYDINVNYLKMTVSTKFIWIISYSLFSRGKNILLPVNNIIA